jgi:superfamily II DNA or RNA helicase
MQKYIFQKPYPHQQKVIDENPSKAILAHEMRTGKSLIAAYWIDHPCRAGNTYIITPKQNKKDWIAFNTKATVFTKEEFKKARPTIKNPTAIVLDELHYYGAPLFFRKGKGRSQLAEALYTLVKENPSMDVLGLTGTPIRQDAWSLHSLLCYIGVYYDWKVWRSTFFELKKMPFLRFPAWFPKKDWRIKIRPILEKHCRIISLRDVVKYLPPIDPVFIKIKQPKYVIPEDRIVTWTDEHFYEQQNKYKEILKLDYRKILVVAHYTAQIDNLAKELGKDKPVFILDGRTKDADKTKREAQEADDCYFIVQSSMGFAFDAWMFGTIVFASMSHSCLNHTQMSGRLRNLEHLKPYNIYYLIGGRWDQRIYDTIEKGKDFNPHIYDRTP